MYLLDNLSNSNVMLFLIIVLLLFIAITIVYIIHLQIESNNRIKKINDNVPIFKETPKSEEDIDLQSITRELETIPKERVINMTPYEEEQEQKAIISYDELVKNNPPGDISYSDTIDDEDIVVKQVDLEDTQRINLEEIKEEKDKVVNLLDYKHEEEFLNELKELNNSIN